MSFIMSYVDAGSMTHPNSFWPLHCISANQIDKTMLMIYHGWHDSNDYPDITKIIGEKIYNINDASVYEATFPLGATYAQLDQAALLLDSFFSLGTQYSYLQPVSFEVGRLVASRIIVTFRADVSAGGSFSDGVTIKVNGSSATIFGTFAHSSSEIWYQMTAPIAPGDVVTWEYDALTGTIVDVDLLPIGPIPASAVSNTVGSNLRFDEANNSIHLAHVF